MTAIGRFSILSETAFNPSIVTFFMTLSGPALTATLFQQLWKDQSMPEMHPRFHSTVSKHRAGYFQQHHEHKSDSDIDTDKSREMEQFSNTKRIRWKRLKRKHQILSAHITDTLYPAVETARKDLTARIIDLQTVSWPLTDSLWHVYVGNSSTSNSAGRMSSASDDSKRRQQPAVSSVFCLVGTMLADGAPWVRRLDS
jgi:hypothetical protein